MAPAPGSLARCQHRAGEPRVTDLFLLPLFDWRAAVCSQHGPEKPTTRFVLLTLALHMSVKGDSCFPSIDKLAEESGLSRRAVIEHLQIAEATGWLAKKDRSTRSGQGWRRVEYYGLIPAGIEAKLRTPKTEVVHQDHQLEGGDFHAEGGDRDRKKVVHQGHPSTSVNSSRVNQGGKPPFLLPDWVPAELWKDWLEVRTKKKVPNTKRALEIAVGKLQALKADGYEPAKVLESAIEKGWRGIFRPSELSTGQPTQNRWWESDSSMEAMAKQHGVNTLGKTRYQLKAAIEEKLGKGRVH